MDIIWTIPTSSMPFITMRRATIGCSDSHPPVQGEFAIRFDGGGGFYANGLLRVILVACNVKINASCFIMDSLWQWHLGCADRRRQSVNPYLSIKSSAIVSPGLNFVYGLLRVEGSGYEHTSDPSEVSRQLTSPMDFLAFRLLKQDVFTMRRFRILNGFGKSVKRYDTTFSFICCIQIHCNGYSTVG